MHTHYKLAVFYQTGLYEGLDGGGGGGGGGGSGIL